MAVGLSLRAGAVALTLFAGTFFSTESRAAYIGSVGAPSSGIATTGGAWLNHPLVTLSWVISENADNSWHYRYVFTTPAQGALSHLILELSSSILGVTTASDPDRIFNLLVSGGSPAIEVATYAPGGNGNSNPNLPGSIYGIKVDPAGDASSTQIDFDVFRAPTWGDFYAKDGKATLDGGRGNIDNSAWNTGLVAGETAGFGSVGSNDPFAQVTNGVHVNSLGQVHILVPDTISTFRTHPNPEPASCLLALAGGAGLFVRRGYRKNRKAIS